MCRWFSSTARRLGLASAGALLVLGVAYAVTLVVGLASLSSPDQAIGDPMFAILEVLVILMMPAVLGPVVAVHAWTPDRLKTLGAP
ncbi:MAG TPA: hypothetical protein VIH37_02160, partial [Candidatus Limnocylindrales bacterium]